MAWAMQALNAPRLAGMSDWYLERQLNNFKPACARCTPTGDYYGLQMGLLSQTLQDDQSVKDMVAYINYSVSGS